MSVSRKSVLAVLRKIESHRETLQDQLEQLQEQFDELSERNQDNKTGQRLQALIDSLEEIIGNLEYCAPDDLGGDL